jgi:hypothetical protein
MKSDPEDLKNLSEDLHGALHRHPDAIRANPDIAADIIKARDKAAKRYEEVTEKKHEPPDHQI